MTTELRRYRRKPDRPITAIRITLETDGFSYRKWGGVQRCKPGDWLVDNGGDVYSVDADVFARTYRPSGPGQFVKISAVWARVAQESGFVETKEGASHFAPGDYIVCNHADGSDAYCMSAARFAALYEEDDPA
ncbi:MAG TPA: hypothetical protein VMU33_08095 [Burkholderiaceae bacterium]|nr:hypothetical protein [Burkholderiaceae bacterium]